MIVSLSNLSRNQCNPSLFSQLTFRVVDESTRATSPQYNGFGKGLVASSTKFNTFNPKTKLRPTTRLSRNRGLNRLVSAVNNTRTTTMTKTKTKTVHRSEWTYVKHRKAT